MQLGSWSRSPKFTSLESHELYLPASRSGRREYPALPIWTWCRAIEATECRHQRLDNCWLVGRATVFAGERYGLTLIVWSEHHHEIHCTIHDPRTRSTTSIVIAKTVGTRESHASEYPWRDGSQLGATAFWHRRAGHRTITSFYWIDNFEQMPIEEGVISSLDNICRQIRWRLSTLAWHCRKRQTREMTIARMITRSWLFAMQPGVVW